MGDHDSEIMDDGCLDRDDAGALGVVAARCEGADAAAVHAGAGGGVSAGLFLDGLLATSDARPDGCARRRRAILGRGASRPSWAAAGGTQMRCAILCGTMSLEHLADPMTRFW